MSRPPATIAEDLAPTGTLRASINLGNPVLAQGTPAAPTGVTVGLARALASRLGVPLELVCFDAARRSFEAMTTGQASAIATTADVDREAVRIGVKRGSAYDLFLSRTLEHASVVRGDEGLDVFRDLGLEVAAGIRQPMTEFVDRHSGDRLIEGPFMEIRQALGTTRTRMPETVRFLGAFVEELKASGFVADALRRAKQRGATVAPPQRFVS